MSLKIKSLLFSLFLFTSLANAQPQLDSMKQRVEQMPADSAKVALLLTIGELLNDKEEARIYISQALDLARSLDLKDLMVSAYVLKGMSYPYNDIDKRIPYLDSALNLSKAMNNPRGVAMVRISKSIIFRTYGLFDQAIRELELSYEYGVASKNEKWQAAVTYHLCGCYMEMEQPEKALPYCQKVANFYQEREDIDSLFRYTLLAFSYSSLAEAAGEMGQIELATDHYLRAYYYARHTDNVRSELVSHLTNLVNLASETLENDGDTNLIVKKIQAIGFPSIEAVLDTAIALANLDTTKLITVAESSRRWALVQGNYEAAYLHLEQIKELDEAGRLSENNLDDLADLKLKSERDQLQIKLLEEKVRTQKKDNKANLTLLFLGISLLLLATSLLFYQNRQKANRLLLSAAKQEQQIISIRSMLEGQEQERARIARDLHDGLGNMLSTVKTTVDSLQHQVHDQQQTYAKASAMIDEAYTEVRKIAHEMMPLALEKLGLRKAIEDLVWKMNANHDFEVSFEVYGEERILDDNTNIMLYRIVQELFNNILKYAAANTVVLQMTFGEDWLNLTMEDNGKGFDPEDLTDSKGIGLKSIAFRTQYIGGEYEINSRPNMGTSVSINVPLVVLSS